MITPFAVLGDKLKLALSQCISPSFFQKACHSQKTLHAAGILLALVMLTSAGCSPRYHDMPEYWPIPTKEYDNYGPGRFKTALLAHQIDKFYRGSAPGPIGVTTFVNIDDLYASSTFGRMVGEQLMSELAMKGFDVVELRHADALQFLDTSGEFALSRDTRALRPHRNLAAVVVGTYVVSPERVYVNARLIEPSTSLILSAGSVEMSKTRELTKMLRGGSMPGSLERIPVKHLGYADQNDSMEGLRRKWAMEEGGGLGGFPGGMSAQPSLPIPAIPQITNGEVGGDGKPSIPKVLGDESAKSADKPDLAIGLGN